MSKRPKMIKKLLSSYPLGIGRKMKILLLIVNAFVLVKAQNETGSILPLINNTELAPASNNPTTCISISTPINSTFTTIDYLNAAINGTSHQEVNSTSPFGNNTEQATTINLTSTSIISNTTIKYPETTINVATEKEINSSSSSEKNTEQSPTFDLTTTSIALTTIAISPNTTTIPKETNPSLPSGNKAEEVTTTILPSTSLNPNTTIDNNPDTAINVTTQEAINSSNSSPGNGSDPSTSIIPNTTTILIEEETSPSFIEEETSPSLSPAKITVTVTTPTKPIIEVKPRKPQKDQLPSSPANNTEKTTMISSSITTTTPITSSSITTITPITSYSITSANTPVNPENWPYTQILTKKNVNLQDHNDKSVQIAVPEDGDFLTFIRQSSFWVDKSLLIPKICGVWKDKSTVLQLSKSIMFPTAPPKWGKTINLSMLKFYFELPTNSDGFPIPKEESASYRYFKEGKVVLEDGSVQELDGIPLISQNDLRNLANHPVVYIKGANYTGNMDSFKAMIHQAFQRHEGLLKRLKLKLETAQVNSKDYNITVKQIQDFLTFYDWDRIKNESHDVKLQMSIEILCELLSAVYESPAVILFDDYDYYIYETFFNLDVRFDENLPTNNFSDFFENFLSDTFKYNEFRTVSVITGVIRANYPSMFSSFDNYHRSYADSVSLFPFYGIFQPEFEQMVQKRGIDRALVDNATQWYGGYYALGNLQTQMYSTHSVTRFINTLQVRNYWPKSRVLGHFFNKILEKPELRQDVLNFTRSLAEHKTSSSILYARFRKLSLEDYKVIRRICMGTVEYQSKVQEYEYLHVRHRDLIFSLMVSEGYAAVHENQTGAILYGIPNAVNITMPNREIYDQLSHFVNLT